jgi:NAD(P)-dependent dehydrogenase (short-subunit alcohol dehydrogenase family)
MSAIAPGNLAIITGGASGIGRAAGTALAKRGMKIALVDQGPSVEATAAEIGGDAAGFICDVSDRAAMHDLAKRIQAKFGKAPSLALNNAGIHGGADCLSGPEIWDRTLAVNLFGVLNGVQAFVPAMIESGQPGIVINTGSKQGITQPPGSTAYNVSKSGVKALTEGLAHTLREQTGGRVTAHLLIPGYTHTGMTGGGEKPSAAWSPDQLADFMLESLGKGDFYILCPDNDVTRAMDEKRMAWHMGDIIENRPALSRWHPDYKDAFAAFMTKD